MVVVTWAWPRNAWVLLGCRPASASWVATGGGGVAGGELAAGERVELADGELADLAVAELGDEVVLDDDPVLRQRGPSQRPTARFALRGFDGQPSAQVVSEALVGDLVAELSVLELLGGDPDLSLRRVSKILPSHASVLGSVPRLTCASSRPLRMWMLPLPRLVRTRPAPVGPSSSERLRWRR